MIDCSSFSGSSGPQRFLCLLRIYIIIYILTRLNILSYMLTSFNIECYICTLFFLSQNNKFSLLWYMNCILYRILSLDFGKLLIMSELLNIFTPREGYLDRKNHPAGSLRKNRRSCGCSFRRRGRLWTSRRVCRRRRSSRCRPGCRGYCSR